MTNACGSLLDASTGDLDKAKVHAMWRHHQERYRESLSEISGLGGASILAVKGAELGAEQLCMQVATSIMARPQSPQLAVQCLTTRLALEESYSQPTVPS